MRALVYVILCVVGVSNSMPLSSRLVDMTYVLKQNTSRYPGVTDFKLNILMNGTIENFGGIWVQMEDFSSGTHLGTHMDAPSHGMKGGINVDDIPLTQLFGPAAVIDITAKAELNADAEATIEDLQQWESATGQSLNGSIILIKSGWGHKWGDQTAFLGTTDSEDTNMHFPGVASSACQWLVDNRNIKGIGVDTLSLDKGSKTNGFESHVITLGHGIFILENVANMDKIPIYGATLSVSPMKIGQASGAPTRIIASIPKVINK